jgi:hypothetical protein
MNPEAYIWPPGWYPIEDQQEFLETAEFLASSPIDRSPLGKTLEAELQREVCPEHPLYGLNITAIGYDAGGLLSDFLFHVEGASFQYAQVHLTWHVEADPFFPYTELYATFEDWRKDREKTDYLGRLNHFIL